jgi:hypothetical protein
VAVLERITAEAVEKNYAQCVDSLKHGPHTLALVLVVLKLQDNPCERVEKFDKMRRVARRGWD